MLFENLDPIPLAFDLGHKIWMVVDEEVQERSDDDIVGRGCIGIAIDGEVKVDGDHWVVDNPAV